MSSMSDCRCLPAEWIFCRSGNGVVLVQVDCLLLQHLAVADDGVQRRSQLVAHVGEELALGTIGRLGRILRFQQLFLGALVGGDVAQHGHAVVQNPFLIFERRRVHAEPNPIRGVCRDDTNTSAASTA